MKAAVIRYHQFGDPLDVLNLEYRPLPELAQGEILVRMKARPINPSDLIPIRGAYRHRIPLPSVPGYEGVGVVENIGAGVSPTLIGSRVLPLRGEGTWQQYVIASEEWAVPVPDFLTDADASQLYINPITAWVVCTERLGLKSGDVLVVNAASSAIGRIFAQLSMILGFKLIAVVRNEIHKEALYALGAWQVINTNRLSLQNTVLQLTHGQGATASIDCIGGVSGAELAVCTRPGGTILSIGLLSGQQVNWPMHVKNSGIHVQIFHLKHWLQNVSMSTWREAFAKIVYYIERKLLKLMEVDQEYDLCDIKSAIHAVEASGRKGKVLLTSYG